MSRALRGGSGKEDPLPKSTTLGAPPLPPRALQAAPGNDGLPPTQPPLGTPRQPMCDGSNPLSHPASGMARHSNPQAGVRTASGSHSWHAGVRQTAPGLGDRRGTTARTAHHPLTSARGTGPRRPPGACARQGSKPFSVSRDSLPAGVVAESRHGNRRPPPRGCPCQAPQAVPDRGGCPHPEGWGRGRGPK